MRVSVKNAQVSIMKKIMRAYIHLSNPNGRVSAFVRLHRWAFHMKTLVFSIHSVRLRIVEYTLVSVTLWWVCRANEDLGVELLGKKLRHMLASLRRHTIHRITRHNIPCWVYKYNTWVYTRVRFVHFELFIKGLMRMGVGDTTIHIMYIIYWEIIIGCLYSALNTYYFSLNV